MSSACFRSSCVVRLFNVTVDASIRLRSACHGWCQCASILVQTAIGHEGLETYGNSIPIIHSVFHISVENQAEKCQKGRVLWNFSSKNAVEISVEVQEKSGVVAWTC